MAWMERMVGCLMVAFAIADPSGNLYGRATLAAQSEQIEDTVDRAADWILRLFRGVDEGSGRSPSAGRDGAVGGGASGGNPGGGDDDGGDDGGGDDGGGDDGGGDD
jgi:hypothetical protein